MIKKTAFIRITILFLLFFSYSKISSQNNIKKTIPLASLLNKLSDTHKVFFTYDPLLIENKHIQEDGFINLSIKESISLLQKLTSFYFDDLGNNYYVLYAKKNDSKRRYVSQENRISFATDSISTFDKIQVKGIVLGTNNQPLAGATLQNTKSLLGTTTNKDGIFVFEVEKNNAISISFLGYNSKTISLTDKKFHTIVLIEGQELDEIKIVGSRNKNRIANDTPVAIDFIDIKKTATKSSQVEINQFLQYAIPSFNATKQSGADGADHIDPATLRGLGPDQTLVLINGKRRHQTSLINLYGTRGRGNSGTDLNAIPIAAIKRIELLRDGASAQYGSDAIAGVINIVLKDTDNQLNINSTLGFYNADSDAILPKSTDGNTYKLALNYGTKLIEHGFLNFSTEVISTDNTFREGTNSREKFGQAAIKNASAFVNSEIPLYKNIKLYANGGFNYKYTEAFAFTRKANSERNITTIYPNGFNPIISSNISDNSLSLGLITNFKDWNIDINNTFGRNYFHYFIKNTLNATLENNSPTEFDAGGHQLLQNTTSIDLSKYFKTKSHGFNIAWGLEYRLNKYTIFAGEEASYTTYDIYGNHINANTPIEDLKKHNGIIRPGGSQGFPGYAPQNEVDRNRSNFSIYADTEFDFSKQLMIGTALRYEFYSDFGSTLNFKVASRYKISPKFNIRSSFSSGFRAPSLAQIYYNLTFTNFIGDTPSESLLIANNNPIARAFNIDKLKEEKALNFSFGFTAKLAPNFNAAIDAYSVAIKDRIILSGNFDATNLNLNVDNVQFFANGVNTQTSGLDIILNWKKKFTDSSLSFELAGNINQMNITEIKNGLLDKETFFGKREEQFLLASAPNSKFNLGINYQFKKVNASLHFTRFSKIELIDWQIHEDLSNFNNSEAQRILAATDYYNSKMTTDLHINYQLNNTINLQVGSNNLLNTYPTKQSLFTDSGGLWDATQMGTNGAFYYTKINLTL